MFANEGRNMLRDTTDRPLSAIKVIRAGGSAAFPGTVSSSQSDKPDRNLLKKSPRTCRGRTGYRHGCRYRNETVFRPVSHDSDDASPSGRRQAFGFSLRN